MDFTNGVSGIIGEALSFGQFGIHFHKHGAQLAAFPPHVYPPNKSQLTFADLPRENSNNDGKLSLRVSKHATGLKDVNYNLGRSSLGPQSISGSVVEADAFASLLRRCGNRNALSEGKHAHTCLIEAGLQQNRFLANLLIHMYGKCGALENAIAVFSSMLQWNVYSWTIMIEAYVQHGRGEDALQIFQRMQLESLSPDKVTFITVLSICASEGTLPVGKQVHASIIESTFELDTVVGNSLLNMYAKCGDLEDAQAVFAKLHHRNVLSWTVMITMCVRHMLSREAFQLFEQMCSEGIVPDEYTYVTLLSACISLENSAEGKKTHACIVRGGYESDGVVGNALVNMYGKCGGLSDAKRIFNKMLVRDVISWNGMITAYVDNGQDTTALETFHQMTLEGFSPDKATIVSGVSACASMAGLVTSKWMHTYIVGRGFELDVRIGNALLNMYSKCDHVENAQRIFNKLHERDVISWNVLIAAYAQHELGAEALQILHDMELDGVVPTTVTFISSLDACTSQASLMNGMYMHARIVVSGMQSGLVIGSALLNMYSKCGSILDARSLFDKMQERDLALWNAMIGAHAHHGHGKEALQLLEQMQMHGFIPDEVTFCGVLSACSHAGLVDEGYDCFLHLKDDHGIIPTIEHYNIVIDLLARSGRLEEGENLVDTMPYEPSATTWTTLLGACRKHMDVERGKRSALRTILLDPKDAGTYLHLSAFYAAGGQWDDDENIEKEIQGGVLQCTA